MTTNIEAQIDKNNDAKCNQILSNDSDVAATHNDDSFEELPVEHVEFNKKTCRICYESDQQQTMIAPCLCCGDLKFVHRKCLDDYRAISVSNPAFTTCNTCNFNYIMEIENNHRCCQSPKTVFISRVIFDIFKMAFCWFGIVSLLAFIFRISGTSDTLISAYLLALGIVFGIMGIIAIIHGCFKLIYGDDNNNNNRNRRNKRNRHNNDDCDCCRGCIWLGPMHCDCGGNSGDAAAVVALILFVISIILIIIGIVYAIIVSSILVTQIAARHYAKLNAKLMAREYVVKNLGKYPRKKLLKTHQEQQIETEQEVLIPGAAKLDEISSDEPKQYKTITIM